MQLRSVVLAGVVGTAAAFSGPAMAPSVASRSAVSMRGSDDQVSKFQEGSDFLFFQSPAPLTSGEFFEAADPPPNFFSGENFRDLQITGTQIAVTVTGVGAFLAVASVIVAPA